MNPAILAAAIERAVRTRRFRYSSETDLHRGLEQAFTEDGLEFAREVPIRGAAETVSDHEGLGRTWKTPTIIGRLKSRIPCHLALREFVILRDKSCRWCGSLEGLVADHVISRRNGGAHHPLNLQALCEGCNAAKAGLVDAQPPRTTRPA